MTNVAEDTLENLQARLAEVRAAIRKLYQNGGVIEGGVDERRWRVRQDLEQQEKDLMARINRLSGGNLKRAVVVDR